MIERLQNMRVGVLLGGPSGEREVSLQTGKAIAEALAGLGYRVVTIDAGSSRDPRILGLAPWNEQRSWSLGSTQMATGDGFLAMTEPSSHPSGLHVATLRTSWVANPADQLRLEAHAVGLSADGPRSPSGVCRAGLPVVPPPRPSAASLGRPARHGPVPGASRRRRDRAPSRQT